MSKSRKKLLVAASIAGLVAANLASAAPAFAEDMALEHCYGINACKGMGACGGKGSSCAGTNACKGQGLLDVPQGTCMKIQGGSLKAV